MLFSESFNLKFKIQKCRLSVLSHHLYGKKEKLWLMQTVTGLLRYSYKPEGIYSKFNCM